MTTQINYFPVIKRTARVAGTDAAGVRIFMKICAVWTNISLQVQQHFVKMKYVQFLKNIYSQ